MIEYPKRGEIYLVSLPSKPKDIKNRPALIVSLDIRNKLANDIIVVPLSTTLRPAPTHVLLSEGAGGLSKASMAKCEQLTYSPCLKAGDSGVTRRLLPTVPACRTGRGA